MIRSCSTEWSTPAPARTRAGFTLIEILVAISVASILLSGVYGIFARISTTERELRARATCYQHARSIFSRMNQELSACILLENLPQSEFRSDENGFLTFTSTSVPQSGGGISMQQVSYRLAQQDNADTLKLQRNSTPLFATEDESLWRRLSSKLVELQWRFHDGTSWQETWDSSMRNSLPKCVELRLILACDKHEVECVSAFDILMAGH